MLCEMDIRREASVVDERSGVMMSSRFVSSFAAAIAVLASLSVSAYAQAPKAGAAAPDPQATTATYGDWTLRCQRAGEPAVKTCEIVQSLQVQGQPNPVAQIALGRPSPKEPLKLVVVVPTNVAFPSSPQLSIDEKDDGPAVLAWRRCIAGGCIAETVLKDDVLKRWRPQAERGRLQFKDATDRDVVLPFSFRGFADALDALTKS